MRVQISRSVVQELPKISDGILQKQTTFQPIDRRCHLEVKEFLHFYCQRRFPVVLKDSNPKFANNTLTPRAVLSTYGEQQVDPSSKLTLQQVYLRHRREGLPRFRFFVPNFKLRGNRFNSFSNQLREIDWSFWLRLFRYLPHETKDYLFWQADDAIFNPKCLGKFGGDAFIFQAYGGKEVFLKTPENHSFPMSAPFLENNDHIPNQVFRVFLQPGDCLYVPCGWQYSEKNHKENINFISNIWHRYNWPLVESQVRSTVLEKFFKKLLVKGSYLALRIRDSLIL